MKKKQLKPEFLDMVPWYSGYMSIVSLSRLAFMPLFFSSIGVGGELLKWNFNTHTHIAGASLLQNIC